MLRFTTAAAVLAAGLLQAAAGAAQQNVETVVTATNGDWEVRCVEGTQQCGMRQTVNNPEGGQPLLEVEVVPIDGNDNAEAVMRVFAPLGVLLTRGLAMRVDGGEPIQTPFLVCAQNGCVANIGLPADGVNTLKRGAAAELTVYAAQQPDQAVNARLSLMGFTRSYDELR